MMPGKKIAGRAAMACALAALCAGGLPSQAQQPGAGGGSKQISPEERRHAFEEAMRRLEHAEATQAAKAAREVALKEEERLASEQLRASVEEEAQRVAAGSIDQANAALRKADAFAAAAAEKVPEDVRPGFVRPRAPEPAAGPAVKPAPAAPGPAKPKAETVIDADGRVIFDGSDRFGKDHQVVIFEDNVVVTNPDFVINGDMLTAYFKRGGEQKPAAPGAPDGADPKAEPPVQQQEANQLERAVVTGREVVVRKHAVEGQEEQIAKARKVTYFAEREEVMLEIWPQVQRGNNLVIAKSKDTVIVLKGQEMIVTGPVRTQISRAEKGVAAPAGRIGPQGAAGDKAGSTVIDATRGAVFNRPGRETKTREMFFDGEVTVADASFDIFAEQLTAYLREGKEGSEVYKTVATGTATEKAVVQRRAPNGEVQIGRAGIITHVASNDDVILDVWPEIRRDVHSGVAKYRDARIVLKKDGNVETRGVDMQIVQEDGRTLTLGSKGNTGG